MMRINCFFSGIPFKNHYLGRVRDGEESLYVPVKMSKLHTSLVTSAHNIQHYGTPTTPLPRSPPPKAPKAPSLNLSVLSISLCFNPCLSLITIACRIVNGSTYLLPPNPPFPNPSLSASASLVMRCRALTARSAGFSAGEGNTLGCVGDGVDEVGLAVGFVCVCVCGWPWDWLKVLECESVGAGLTAPMERREAAKCGSRPSRSIAVLLVWV